MSTKRGQIENEKIYKIVVSSKGRIIKGREASLLGSGLVKGLQMPMHLFRRFFRTKKTLFQREVQQMSGFMRLLMKQRNTEAKWTSEDIAELKTYIRHLKSYMPLLTCFLLPGGFLLLPLLAARLDRRKSIRPEHGNHEEIK